MPKHTNNKDTIVCSFCGKTQEQVRRLVAGPNVYVCDECVEICNDIIKEGTCVNVDEKPAHKDLKPKEINAILDEYVIGQDRAKKSLAVAMYNHYKRINKSKQSGVDLQKSNILLVGSTGSGKTYLVQTLAKILDVPLVITDATTLTEAGYVGDDVESILSKLLQTANYDIKRAERGIVYIDEIDKITHKTGDAGPHNDVPSEGVQQSLLKLLEGTTITVPHGNDRNITHLGPIVIDTTNVLFICGGSFDGITRFIQQRVATSNIGFRAKSISKNSVAPNELFKYLMPEDLLKFGFIPEFIGRLPIIATLDTLDETMLRRILAEPRNALVRQFQEILTMDGIELEFTEEALSAIARRVQARKTGARGLRAVVEEVMLDIMYDLPSLEGVEKCIIDENVVNKKETPTIVYKEKEEIAV